MQICYGVFVSMVIPFTQFPIGNGGMVYRQKSFVEIITNLMILTGNIRQSMLLEKGISTALIPFQYKKAIKKYFSDIKFDLVLYSTPPITLASVVEYVQKRDHARTYLLLKDIFPQNAVDLGVLRKTGLKGILHFYYRLQEKKLYRISDTIGCMSPANCAYLLEHNREVSPNTVEISANCLEIQDMRVNAAHKAELRQKYGLPSEKKIFVYGGNLGRAQDIPFLIACIKACTEIQDAYFVVAGSGVDRHRIETYIKVEKPKNAKLFDRMPREEYDAMIACCDVGLILLDHRFTIPNFPSRLLSYMQAGLPVIVASDNVTDVGSICVEGGFGWSCCSTEVNEFVGCIEQAVASDCTTLGAIAYAYFAEKYSVEKQYEAIIKRTMTRNYK